MHSGVLIHPPSQWCEYNDDLRFSQVIIIDYNIRNTFGTNLPVDFLSFFVLCTYICVYVSYVL